MARVTTPVEGFSGNVVGVVFVDGKGETADGAALAYFRRQGYGIEDTLIAEDASEDGDSELLDLDGMTVDQLKAFAAEHEYTLGDAVKKADIIEAIVSQIPTIVGDPVE